MPEEMPKSAEQPATGTDIVPEKKPKTKQFLQLAKGFKRTKTLVKIVAGSGALILAGVVAVPLLGTLMLLGLAVGAIAFLGTVMYSLNFLKKKTGYEFNVANFMKAAESAVANAKDIDVSATASTPPQSGTKNGANDKNGAGAKSSEQAKASDPNVTDVKPQPPHKLWDLQGHVYLFEQEPSVSDLIKARSDAATATKPGVTAVPNETPIRVLLDEKKESVKVEVLVGEAKGKTGWVCRSCVVKEDSVVA